VVRPSTVAVLRSNAQVLELMAAQCEELANRTADQDEYRALKSLAFKCRLICSEFKDVADINAVPPRGSGASASDAA
jgi:hypothetical protein